jgi:hypothetical protein
MRNPQSFVDSDQVIGWQLSEGLLSSTRPANLQINGLQLPDAKVQSAIVGREKTTLAHYFLYLEESRTANFHSRSNGRTV